MDFTKQLGRPRIYKTVNSLKKKILEYFASITITRPRTVSVFDHYEKDENGKDKAVYVDEPLLNNLGEQVFETIWLEKPSILSMCLYLKITRETLIHMSKNPIIDKETNEVKQDFSDTIKKAKSVIEQYKADQLDRSSQVAGIIFDLKYNFGWRDDNELLKIQKEKAELDRERFEFEKEQKSKGSSTEELLETLKSIKTLADYIDNPKPNRSLEDYE